MSLNKVAVRYSKTLFLSADKLSALDDVSKDLDFIQALCIRSPELVRALNNPLISTKKLHDALLKTLPQETSVLFKMFVALLFNKKRGPILPLVPKLFKSLYEKKNKTVRVMIKSAKPFSPPQIEKLKISVAKKTGAQSVIIESKIDSSLIAGFQLILGDTVYDANIKHSLVNLKKKLVA